MLQITQRDSIQEIKQFRQQYLDELFESQELFLELKIRKAHIFLITMYHTPVGYCFIDPDQILLEYYVIPAYVSHADKIFEEIVKRCAVNKAYCKSFDFTLLSCCAGLQKQTNVAGILSREYEKQALTADYSHLTVRFAEPKDEAHIAEINEDVFDYDEEITEYITGKNILIFEHEGDMVGFGLFHRVIEGRPEFDIGMLVDRKYRRKGYGSYILQYLAEYCREQGWRPTCGCAVENTGSRACIENIGCITRYRMLEFIF